MKLKFVLFLLLLISCELYPHTNRFLLTGQQTVSPYLNLRFRSSMDFDGESFNLDMNGMNFVIRQDYSNMSNYVVSLNPGLWCAEWGLTKIFESSWSDWGIIPLTISAADMLSSLRLDIYYARFGIDTDYYIYNDKLLCVVELSAGVKYEFKNFIISAAYEYTLQHKEFMAPWEDNNGKVAIGLTYNFDDPVTRYIFSRGAVN